MGGPGGVRSGKTGLSRLQMLDEQRMSDSMLGSHQGLPSESIKGQFENLISTLGLEAHKAQAILHEASEQDHKFVDEICEKLESRLAREKSAFEDTV